MTPQYAGLRTLEEGGAVKVLGVPCNQFGRQEPGSNEQILDFARSRYDANFQLFEKAEVNGPGACELYRLLKAEQPGADGGGDIKWNFTKFLVDATGAVIARYEPGVTPAQIGRDLESQLG